MTGPQTEQTAAASGTDFHDPEMSRHRDLKLEAELHLDGLHPIAAARVFSDLSAYLQKPIRQIAEDYWHYHTGEDRSAQERVAQASTEEEVNAYYAKTPHYLYELSYWEASRAKQAWLKVLHRACLKYGLHSLVDFGGGVGTVSTYLQRRGIRCTHLDVAGKTLDYACWRFRRHQLPVTAINVVADWPKGPFDAIVAWDVLEHIFDLEGTLAKLANLLKTGGWLISLATFADKDGEHEPIHLAKHAVYHDLHKWNALLSSCGLDYKGQLKPDRMSRLLRACGLTYAVSGIRIAARLKHGGNFLIHTRRGSINAT